MMSSGTIRHPFRIPSFCRPSNSASQFPSFISPHTNHLSRGLGPLPITCILSNDPGGPNPNRRNNRARKKKKNKRPNKMSDAKLAMELSAAVERVKTRTEERQKAMESSMEMLFGELCDYLKSDPEEVKREWRRMGDDERWLLVSRFVSDWGTDFHPISTRGVKELVQEFVGVGGSVDDGDDEIGDTDGDDDEDESDLEEAAAGGGGSDGGGGFSAGFAGFIRLMGFGPN